METFLPFDCGLPEQHAPKKKRRGRIPQVIYTYVEGHKVWLDLGLHLRAGRQWPASQSFVLLKEFVWAVLRHWLFKLLILGAAAFWSMTIPISDGTLKGPPSVDPWQAVVTRH